MFPGMPVQANKQERKLIKVFKSLNSTDKETLITFAEFLQSRSIPLDNNIGNTPEIPNEPLVISRPETESVVAAIKRLTATYPMVNKDDILHPISSLMTSHIMQGKKAKDVIDKLEHLFEDEYIKLNNQGDGNK